MPNYFSDLIGFSTHTLIKSIYPLKKESCYVAGWVGSGSTFIYQAISKMGIRVNKVHGVPKYNKFNITFYTIRDPRDVILSTARRSLNDILKNQGLTKAIEESISQFVNKHKFIEDYFQATRLPNTLIIRYETFFNGNQNLLLQFLADQLSVPISQSKTNEILDECSIEANMKRMGKYNNFHQWDKKSQIHGNHISNKGKIGGWKDIYNSEICEMIDYHIGDFLIALKYEENRNWVNLMKNVTKNAANA